ncbi:30S ribosomal protein S13 [Candidatus Pacearchaeota archaeon RBG_13_36_9]|nr:MAG: 30S ribosomal protein S13 [Candidatus Pacearchaeota archaeon RBG_13_36_9]
MQEKKSKEVERKPARETGKIVRIMQTDIPGEKQVYVGLTKIKGVSWSFSNALCHKIGMDKKKKISDLNAEEIKKIEEFIKNPILPPFLLNRRRDLESGEDKHLITTDLDLRKDFDIKRLKKIRSYRGLRHATGQPTRGQRTKSHFRQKGKSMGVIKKAKIGKKS